MGLLIRFASQWVAGETMADGLARAAEANRRGLGAILNLLGEHHTDPAAIDADVREYLELLDAIRERKLDACLSIKPTQCGLMLGEDAYWRSTKTILDRVRSMGGFLWMDMEGSRFTDATLAVYRRALAEYPEVGVAVQANLRRTEGDVASLLEVGGIVRLVKGAYREPPPAGTAKRRETDANYRRLLDLLFERGERFAVGSHDSAMIDYAIERNKSRSRRLEFQMLLGVRDPLKADLARNGYRVAEFIPYGPNWLPYFTRRLRERPRNILTMVRSFVSG
jgi:proline dehydrogenase